MSPPWLFTSWVACGQSLSTFLAEMSTKYSLIYIISCLKPFRLLIALGLPAQAVSTGGKALPDLIQPRFLLRPYHCFIAHLAG